MTDRCNAGRKPTLIAKEIHTEGRMVEHPPPTAKYSRTSMARTLIAHLPWIFHIIVFGIISGNFLFCIEKVC